MINVKSDLCVNKVDVLKGWSKSKGGGGWAGGKWGVGQQVSSLSKGWVTPVFSEWWSGS